MDQWQEDAFRVVQKIHGEISITSRTTLGIATGGIVVVLGILNHIAWIPAKLGMVAALFCFIFSILYWSSFSVSFLHVQEAVLRKIMGVPEEGKPSAEKQEVDALKLFNVQRRLFLYGTLLATAAALVCILLGKWA